MSNFNMTSGQFNDSPANECFIEDIMAKAVTHKLIFTRDWATKKFHLYALPNDTPLFIGIAPLPDDPETQNCFFGDYHPIMQTWELLYTWEDSANQLNTLIWWDHDLGDVVLDSFNETVEDGVPTDKSDYELICKIGDSEIYFYYIT